MVRWRTTRLQEGLTLGKIGKLIVQEVVKAELGWLVFEGEISQNKFPIWLLQVLRAWVDLRADRSEGWG